MLLCKDQDDASVSLLDRYGRCGFMLAFDCSWHIPKIPSYHADSNVLGYKSSVEWGLGLRQRITLTSSP